jgi:ketosteroid isomerase-like protein
MRKRQRNVIRVTLLAAALLVGAAPAQAQVVAELDAYWAEVERTAREGDFEGYAAVYHEDAVLVSAGSMSSYPISAALAGWRQGFVDTREGRVDASVEFRFSQRLNDETTAHETGIFHYRLVNAAGEVSESRVHFEALMVKKDGTWLMLMEYQKEPATDAEWNALR